MEYTTLGVLMFRRSEEGRRLRRESMRQGKDYTPFQAKEPYLRADGIMNTLTLALTKDNLLVLAIPKSTSTQSKYMKNNSQELKTMATSPKSTKKNYQTSTVSLAASCCTIPALLVKQHKLNG